MDTNKLNAVLEVKHRIYIVHKGLIVVQLTCGIGTLAQAQLPVTVFMVFVPTQWYNQFMG